MFILNGERDTISNRFCGYHAIQKPKERKWMESIAVGREPLKSEAMANFLIG
jgi:hypothetical protein